MNVATFSISELRDQPAVCSGRNYTANMATFSPSGYRDQSAICDGRRHAAGSWRALDTTAAAGTSPRGLVCHALATYSAARSGSRGTGICAGRFSERFTGETASGSGSRSWGAQGIGAACLAGATGRSSGRTLASGAVGKFGIRVGQQLWRGVRGTANDGNETTASPTLRSGRFFCGTVATVRCSSYRLCAAQDKTRTNDALSALRAGNDARYRPRPEAGSGTSVGFDSAASYAFHRSLPKHRDQTATSANHCGSALSQWLYAVPEKQPHHSPNGTGRMNHE